MVAVMAKSLRMKSMHARPLFQPPAALVFLKMDPKRLSRFVTTGADV